MKTPGKKANVSMHGKHGARGEDLVVVLFSDRWALYGLHAALASLLAHAQSVCLRVIVFSDGLTSREKKLLRKTAGKFNGKHSFEIRDLNLKWPEGTPSFHGNLTTNARIFLPSLLPDCDRILYMDADIIVLRDVGELLQTPVGHPLSVVCYEPPEGHQDFAVIRANATGPGGRPSHMFYAGFFLTSLATWRELDISKRCAELLPRLSGTIKCPDLVVLNIAFHGRWHSLDPSWNTMLWPRQPKISSEKNGKVIWHFLGVPKPWYPLGRFAHGNFEIWNEWHKKTALARSPLSWIINYLTPRRHYMDFALETLRLIAARWKNKFNESSQAV